MPIKIFGPEENKCAKNFLYAKRTHYAVTVSGDTTYNGFIGRI